MNMKTFVLTTMLFASVSASSFRRAEQVVDSSTKSWNCSIVDNTCKCPESCMIQKPGESYCVLKDCYKYDENLDHSLHFCHLGNYPKKIESNVEI